MVSLHCGLDTNDQRCYGRQMQRRIKTRKMDQLERALDDVGGDPLYGSGFEGELPEEGFSGGVALPWTYLPASPKGSH